MGRSEPNFGSIWAHMDLSFGPTGFNLQENQGKQESNICLFDGWTVVGHDSFYVD